MAKIIGTVLGKAFLRSSGGVQSATENKPICSTNYVAFQKTFQTFNKYIYQTENVQPGQLPAISKIYAAHEILAGSHFKTPQDIDTTYSVYACRSHAMISYIEYTRTTSEKKQEKWAAFTICDANLADNKILLNPNILMTGKIEYINDEYSIIPMNAEYLTERNGKNFLVSVKERQHFRQFMAYANQAFIQAVSNQKLDPIENSKWMTDNYRETARKLFDTFPDRTFGTLSNDVEDYNVSEKSEQHTEQTQAYKL